MTDRNDLTRWNRAGLRKLTYVEGNAPLFLDELRAALKDRFPSAWAGLPASEGDIDAGATEAGRYQRNRKIIEQYYGERRDPGWEVARAVSRSCHVLTGQVDAFANEAFIRTATQWDDLRRLVELIDYHPAAATSASTDIVLLAKPDRKGTVKKGFQVKYTPPEGGPPVIFETLEDLEIDPDLNALRPKGWDVSEGSAAVPEADDGAGPDGEGGSSEPDDGGQPAPGDGPGFSNVALYPARNIQGVGPERAAALDTLTGGGEGSFLIKDFLTLDPANPGLPEDRAIPETWLREIKAKAIALTICEFDPGWANIVGWSLPGIATASSDVLAEYTGETVEAAEALKLRLELFSTYLNAEIFKEMRLEDLLAPAAESVPGEIKTAWRRPKKPNVVAGQVALVFDEDRQIGEAVTIARIGDDGGEATDG